MTEQQTLMNAIKKSFDELQKIQDAIEAGIPKKPTIAQLIDDGGCSNYRSHFMTWEILDSRFDDFRDLMLGWYLESSECSKDKEQFYNPFYTHRCLKVNLWELLSKFREILRDAIKLGIEINDPYGYIEKEIRMCIDYYDLLEMDEHFLPKAKDVVDWVNVKLPFDLKQFLVDKGIRGKFFFVLNADPEYKKYGYLGIFPYIEDDLLDSYETDIKIADEVPEEIVCMFDEILDTAKKHRDTRKNNLITLPFDQDLLG